MSSAPIWAFWSLGFCSVALWWAEEVWFPGKRFVLFFWLDPELRFFFPSNRPLLWSEFCEQISFMPLCDVCWQYLSFWLLERPAMSMDFYKYSGYWFVFSYMKILLHVFFLISHGQNDIHTSISPTSNNNPSPVPSWRVLIFLLALLFAWSIASKNKFFVLFTFTDVWLSCDLWPFFELLMLLHKLLLGLSAINHQI